MANRNRVIYQSEGLFVSENASSILAEDVEQLGRVQSANYSFTINRQDVNQYGDLARIDSLVLDPPTVNVDFSYLLADGFNERALGFFVQNSGGANTQRGGGALAYSTGSFSSGHLVATSGVNLYIVTSPDGVDLNQGGLGEALNNSDTTIGIGNCYISDYSLDLSVGSLPTVSVTMEGANMRSISDSGLTGSPAINQANGEPIGMDIELPNPTKDGGITGAYTNGGAIIALRPGDVTVSLADVAGESLADIAGDDGAHIQSVSISLPLARSPLQRLGSKFPFARTVDFPVEISMNVSAVMNDTQSANLTNILESGVQDVSFEILDPTGGDPAIRGELKSVRLDSQSFSSSIGANKTVDLTFSTQVSGPHDAENGFFMSGCGWTTVFQ